jgi:hypothetical protein
LLVFSLFFLYFEKVNKVHWKVQLEKQSRVDKVHFSIHQPVIASQNEKVVICDAIKIFFKKFELFLTFYDGICHTNCRGNSLWAGRKAWVHQAVGKTSTSNIISRKYFQKVV